MPRGISSGCQSSYCRPVRNRFLQHQNSLTAHHYQYLVARPQIQRFPGFAWDYDLILG